MNFQNETGENPSCYSAHCLPPNKCPDHQLRPAKSIKQHKHRALPFTSAAIISTWVLWISPLLPRGGGVMCFWFPTGWLRGRCGLSLCWVSSCSPWQTLVHRKVCFGFFVSLFPPPADFQILLWLGWVYTVQNRSKTPLIQRQGRNSWSLSHTMQPPSPKQPSLAFFTCLVNTIRNTCKISERYGTCERTFWDHMTKQNLLVWRVNLVKWGEGRI